MTSLTLQKDDVTEATLNYEYHTELLEYADGSSQNFLIGKVNLDNLPTYNIYETEKAGKFTSEIRITVGWRYSWQDAYDLTSFRVNYRDTYQGDETDKQYFKCIDGFSNGSIST